MVGAGAAGLATAIFTRRADPRRGVVLLDGSSRPGAKILISGGGRCNVTNVQVEARDYWSDGSRAAIRQVLRAFPVDETRAWFAQLGIALHEEEDGKLFPDSNRARDVLTALLGEAARTGATLEAAARVQAIDRAPDSFVVRTTRGDIRSGAVVLATGGRSLPKTGSDGGGYALAQALGHGLVPPCPALTPLVLDAVRSPHAGLSGVAHRVELTIWLGGRAIERVAGSLLWTHTGVSGPAALDSSRHWERARLDGRAVRLTMSVCPGQTIERLDAALIDAAGARPRAALATVVAALVPAAVAGAFIRLASVDPACTMARLTRDDRRRLARVLTEWELPVVATRGFAQAEVTAGGVRLGDIDPRTMESRVCPGLYLVGEILDVDGRLGGFNFQWAWASARVAARGLCARPSRP
ncbi:MAG: NAD(P)/FAD-dependent oxidoreductase [Vicinamibacterales bacterium]